MESLESSGLPDPSAADEADSLAFPLSFAQQRLWFLNQLDPDSAAYNVSIALRLRGPLDVRALQKSLNEILRRHDALRTCFPARNGKPVQVISAPSPLPLIEEDLRHIPEASRESEALRRAAEEVAERFDLARGPLLRARRLRLAEKDSVLLLTMHHIVSDGWSKGVLLSELAVLYDAFRRGVASPLPELPIQYADYAIWQRQWLQGEILERQLAYWKDKLQGPAALLELPIDRPRPAVAASRGAMETAGFSKALLEALSELSRGEGTTLYMTLLAVFQTLLARLTGQDDIWVGCPIAGRTQLETEGLIGFFVNTLVLRTDLSGDPTFRELLGRAREVALGAYAHQEIPFEKLVEELQPSRSMSVTPLFQVMFSLESAGLQVDTPGNDVAIPGLTATWMRAPRNDALFDLTLVVRESEDGLSCSLKYRTDLFESATVRRLLGHLEVLLAGIVESPDLRLSQLPLLTAAERNQILVEWNRTEAEYPQDQMVPGLVEEQARRNPETIAVEFAGERLTYGELNRRSNQLARHLRRLGVRPEVLVGLCMDRSLEAVVGLLGILKAGGAYLPLDPAYPTERLRFMLEDSGAGWVLTHRATAGKSPSAPAQTIPLDASWETIARESGEDFESGVQPENLAYVLYTSGSTGRPKGVETEHAGLANHIRFVADLFGVRVGERVLQFGSLSFDVATQEIFAALSGGGTLVLRSEEMIETFGTFLARCREWRLSIVDLPTSFWHELVAFISAERLELPPLLRTVVIGGERALPEPFARWRKIAGNRVRLINDYGPTEASIAATFWEPGADLPAWISRTVPIGRPMANVRTYVLDGNLQPVAIGVAGELYIGGRGVARGYRNRPDLTVEKFLPNPFRDGERLYRTGDRARFLPDGNLEYLGRTDDQIKLRGFRVEPGEIETALRAIAGVREAVVRAREDAPGQARLVAYVVPDPAGPPVISDLRERLQRDLPAHMVPSNFVLLDALPKTVNGKLDAASLPAPESVPSEGDGLRGPRTPVEKVLTEIWMKVLGIDTLGVHDNFFELGGHSLLAMQVISRARDAFRADLPLRDLFLNPTVAGLALAIDQRQARQVAPAELDRLLSDLESIPEERSVDGR